LRRFSANAFDVKLDPLSSKYSCGITPASRHINSKASLAWRVSVDVARGGIDENTAALVHLALLGLPLAGEQSASCGADEVVDRDALPRKELILS
jgi:hypothetical protein